MCAGAILQARVDRVVYGAQNSLLGADGSWVQLFPQLIASDQDQIHAHAGHHELQQTGLRHPFHVSMRVCILLKTVPGGLQWQCALSPGVFFLTLALCTMIIPGDTLHLSYVRRDRHAEFKICNWKHIFPGLSSHVHTYLTGAGRVLFLVINSTCAGRVWRRI